MSLKPFQEKILEQLIEQEDLLSKLYTIFSEQFPEHKEFWGKLSQEENRHAKLITRLYQASQKGTIVFDEGKIRTYTLTAFITRLKGIIEKAERGEFTDASAFSYAVDYESSLIEKNVFSHFDSLSTKIKGTLDILRSETINHVKRIKDAKNALLVK